MKIRLGKWSEWTSPKAHPTEKRSIEGRIIPHWNDKLTVKRLIKELQKFDPEHELEFCDEERIPLDVILLITKTETRKKAKELLNAEVTVKNNMQALIDAINEKQAKIALTRAIARKTQIEEIFKAHKVRIVEYDVSASVIRINPHIVDLMNSNAEALSTALSEIGNVEYEAETNQIQLKVCL